MTKILSNGQEILFTFDYPISKIIKNGNSFIVSLNIPSKQIFNENIFSIRNDGQLIWQVEKLHDSNVNSPYTNIVLKDGKLKAISYDGWSEFIDIPAVVGTKKRPPLLCP